MNADERRQDKVILRQESKVDVARKTQKTQRQACFYRRSSAFIGGR
jgi:hypothetical protein